MEDKVTRILKLSSGLDTEQLSELIQDLHQKYQSICDQYSNLTQEIKNQVDEKQNNGASSSSSDSDESVGRSSRSQNGKLEGESPRAIEELKQELELAKLEVVESKKKKEAVHSEYRTALMKIQEAEITIVDLNIAAENYSAENQRLREKLEEMVADRESMIMDNCIQSLNVFVNLIVLDVLL